MKLISHRGNTKGRQPERENSREYIDQAIELGYDVEVDVRTIGNVMYFGHDTPQYKIDVNWLLSNIDRLWIHCKDIGAHKEMSKIPSAKYFCHTSDPFCVVSSGHLWVHDLTLPLNDRCIIPLLSLQDIQRNPSIGVVYAICTDHTDKIK